MELTTDVPGAGRAQALLAALRKMNPRMKTSDLTAMCTPAGDQNA